MALFVGTLLFSINHGAAVLNDEMSSERWVSALLTYAVPFMVSIHGQSSRRTSA
ncbi:MAG: nitrate/nitrite transporter NrtS [Cyanobacteria bacterium J06598_1]